MGVGSLGIPEDGVRQPNQSHHVAVQSQFLHRAVVSEAAVGPRLSEDDVDLVLLKEKKTPADVSDGASVPEWNVPLAEILTGLL